MRMNALSTILLAGGVCAAAWTARAQGNPHAAAAPSAAPDSISGKYAGTFQGGSNGDITATLTIQRSGGDLTGTIQILEGHEGLSGTLRGTLNDGRIALEFALGPKGDHRGTITAHLEGDAIVGKWDSDGNGGPARFTRSAEAAAPGKGNASASGTTAALANPYGPYAVLVGIWDVSPEAGGPAVAVQRFTWGPNRAYIWYAGSLVMAGKEEPHFEGLLAWDGIHRNLDMLMTIDLRFGLAAERGTFSLQPDGSFLREITAVYSEGVTPIGRPRAGAEGATGHFRQIYRPTGPDQMAISVLRETERGWVATFPGSDHLLMKRRKA